MKSKKAKTFLFCAILTPAIVLTPLTAFSSCSPKEVSDIQISLSNISSHYITTNDQVIKLQFHTQGNNNIKQLASAKIVNTNEPIQILNINPNDPIYIDDNSNFEIEIGYKGAEMGPIRDVPFAIEFTYLYEGNETSQTVTDSKMFFHIDVLSAYLVGKHGNQVEGLQTISYTIQLEGSKLPQTISNAAIVGDIETTKLELKEKHSIPVDETTHQFCLTVCEKRDTPISIDETISFHFHFSYTMDHNNVEIESDDAVFEKINPTITWDNGPKLWKVYDDQWLTFKFSIQQAQHTITKIKKAEIEAVDVPPQIHGLFLYETENIPIVDSSFVLYMHSSSSISQGFCSATIKFNLNLETSDGITFDNYVTPVCNFTEYKGPEDEKYPDSLKFIPLQDGTLTINAENCDITKYTLQQHSDIDIRVWNDISLEQPAQIKLEAGKIIELRNVTRWWSIFNQEDNKWHCPKFESDVPFVLQGRINWLVGDYDSLGDGQSLAEAFKGTKVLKVSENFMPIQSMKQSTHAFDSLFESSDLIYAPDLSSEDIGPYCYQNMFHDCKQLQRAPQTLPAKVTKQHCYNNMFANCTALEFSPVIGLETVNEGDEALQNMFADCKLLSSIHLEKIQSDFDDNFISWVKNVAKTGKFFYRDRETIVERSENTIPEGWTII